MATYTDRDGREFDLPKMTAALEDAFDRAADKSRPKRDRARDAHKLMKDALGADYVAERCGGKTAETVDVTALWALFGEVHAAYFAELDAAEAERIMAKLEAVAPLLDQMAKVAPLMARQGFKAVL